MSKDEKIAAVKRIFSTVEYRSLDRPSRGVKIVKEEKVSKTIAAKAADMSRYALKRALDAEDENREIGRNGRPSLFNESENLALLVHLENLPADTRITYSVLRSEFQLFWGAQLRNKNKPKTPVFGKDYLIDWVRKKGFKMQKKKKSQKNGKDGGGNQ